MRRSTRVISQFGMMFFEDRQKSTDEMFRVLKPGGSVAIAVWRSVEHNPAYGDIISVLEQQVGTAAADALRLPYGLGDADKVTAVLESSGFREITVEAKTETARFPERVKWSRPSFVAGCHYSKSFSAKMKSTTC